MKKTGQKVIHLHFSGSMSRFNNKNTHQISNIEDNFYKFFFQDIGYTHFYILYSCFIFAYNIIIMNDIKKINKIIKKIIYSNPNTI